MNSNKSLTIEELNKELKDFLYIITHDLKNPIRGIKQSADWLLEDQKSKLDDEAIKLLELLQEKSKLLSDMIDALNNYSKLSFKENLINEFSFDMMVDAVTEDINKLQIKEGGKNKLLIDKEYKTNLILKTDELKLSQILSDLVKTCMYFADTNQNEIICIIKHNVEEEEDYHIISINIKNTILPTERISKIFSPFQEHSIGTKKINTMMTLAQAKKLIQLLGGELEAKKTENNDLEFIIKHPNYKT